MLRKSPVKKRAGPRPAGAGRTKSRKLRIEDYIPYLVNRAAIAMLSYSALDFQRHGLTAPQWRILAAVRGETTCRFGKLAEITSIEPSTLSRLLNGLQERGLVRRDRAPSDSRAVDVSLTAEGIRKVEDMLPFALEVNAGFLAGISKTDVETARRVLTAIYHNALRMEATRSESA